mmetsp:Transcript_9376/g.31361  ORF Transcript_9376/g.31361 Transcript_9376/m.31361 type:complete len:432 (+) Transcript_9376:238-1533(+)
MLLQRVAMVFLEDIQLCGHPAKVVRELLDLSPDHCRVLAPRLCLLHSLLLPLTSSHLLPLPPRFLYGWNVPVHIHVPCLRLVGHQSVVHHVQHRCLPQTFQPLAQLALIFRPAVEVPARVWSPVEEAAGSQLESWDSDLLHVLGHLVGSRRTVPVRGGGGVEHEVAIEHNLGHGQGFSGPREQQKFVFAQDSPQGLPLPLPLKQVVQPRVGQSYTDSYLVYEQPALPAVTLGDPVLILVLVLVLAFYFRLLSLILWCLLGLNLLRSLRAPNCFCSPRILSTFSSTSFIFLHFRVLLSRPLCWFLHLHFAQLLFQCLLPPLTREGQELPVGYPSLMPRLGAQLHLAPGHDPSERVRLVRPSDGHTIPHAHEAHFLLEQTQQLWPPQDHLLLLSHCQRCRRPFLRLLLLPLHRLKHLLVCRRAPLALAFRRIC